LPVIIEEIDCDWLTAALRTHAPDVTVRGAQIVDITRGTCTKIRLRLDMEQHGPQTGIPDTVILKGGFEPHSRDLWFMHQAEVRGYRDVLPVLKMRSPACYFADYDPERRQGIVIMEDLVARGVTFCHPLKPQVYEQVARRLTALAQHHAKTWGSLEFLPGGRWDWATDLAAFCPKFFQPFFEPETWQRFMSAPRAAAASVYFNSEVWLASALDGVAILSKQLPHCLIHGDTHLGNLYVDLDGTPGFFDAQPHRAPAMIEIAYHITGALDPADRRRWERALVQHYLSELMRNGVATPDFEEAISQYGTFLAVGYCIFLFNESVFQSEAINTAYTARFSAAMIDNNTIELLKKIV
jgi:hypothetical protein